MQSHSWNGFRKSGLRLLPVFLATIAPFMPNGFTPDGSRPAANHGLYSEAIAATAEPHIPDLSKPPPLSTFNSLRLNQQLAVYELYLAEFGPPDILIVGSSRSLQGIDPVWLQKSLVQRGHPELKVFNFGVNGATAQVVNLLLQEILLPSQLPQMVVWADGSRAFNAGRPDITYNGIKASVGYQRLKAGHNPISSRPQARQVSQDRALPIPDRCKDVPIDPVQPADAEDPINQTVVGHPADYAMGYLMHSSRSVEAAMPLYHVADVSRLQNLPCPPVTPSPAVRKSIRAERQRRVPSPLDDLGFLSVLIRFNPDSYYQENPRVKGLYDQSYIPFQLEGVQTNATLQLGKFLRERQIPLVFVNLPLSNDYLDPTRLNYEQQFIRHMRQLSGRASFLFRDLLQRWPSQDQYFMDPSHLNQFGARAVAGELAKDPAIPWPQQSESP